MAVVDMIFKRDVSPAQAADQLGAALAALPGFRQEEEQQIGEEMFTMRWLRDGDRQTAVDLTFDRSVPLLMASVISDDQAQAESVAASLRRALSQAIDSSDELLSAASESPTEPAPLVRAAVAFAQRFDGRLFSLIDDALRSADVAMRQAGAKSAALVKYAQLEPTLRQAVDREKDDATARMLALAMTKIRNHPA